MAIWDVIGNLAEWTGWGALGFTNSSYGSVIGDEMYFTLGGGAAYNVLGTQTNLVIDWEAIIEHIFHLGPINSFSGKMGGALLGIGGDSTMVLGNSNNFSYMGDEFSVVRGRNTIECKYDSGDLNTLKSAGASLSPYNLPFYTVLLGSLALFTGALVLQLGYKVGLGDGNPDSTAAKLAITAIPILESRWLWLVKFLEFVGCAAIPLKANLIGPVLGKKSAIEIQLNDIEEKIEAADFQVKALSREVEATSKSIINCKSGDAAILNFRLRNATNQLGNAKKSLEDLTANKANFEKQYLEAVANLNGLLGK